MKITKSNFKLLCLFSLAIFVMSCSNKNSGISMEEEKEKKPLMESLTYEGYKEFSFKYNSGDSLIEYCDNNLHSLFEISYNPLKVKISYLEPNENGDLEISSVQDIYDAVLNDAGCLISFKYQYTNGGEDPTVNYGSVDLSYNSDNRLTEMIYSTGETVRLEWNAEGSLLKASTSEYDITYTPSVIPNTYNEWNPLWYSCGGWEMTGLLGNAPSMLIDSGVQTFKNGVNSSARFEYKLKEDKLIEEITFWEDDFEPKVFMVNYKK